MGAQRWVNHPTLGRMTLEHYNEISPLIRPLRVTVDAADHDRIVAEAETRGWNAGLSDLDKQLAKAMDLLDGDPSVIGLRKARAAITALRKPEVEG